MELKKCPCCGGKAEFHACAELENKTLGLLYKGKVGVHCTVCGIATLPCDNEDAATEVWNKRSDEEELAFTRKFIHDNGLEFALAEAWRNRNTVEVVRCAECKNLNVVNHDTVYAICKRTGFCFEPFKTDTRTHFCSYGERKDNAVD